MRAFLNFIKKIFFFLFRKKKVTDSASNESLKIQEVISEPIVDKTETKKEEVKVEISEQIFKPEQREKKQRKKKEKPIPEFTVMRTEDVPDVLKPKVIYIVGDKGYEWLIAMTCPCGCKEQILLNTLKETKPCWRFVCYTSGSVSIIPSVNRIRNCKSHFTITKGRINWWNDYNYPNNS